MKNTTTTIKTYLGVLNMGKCKYGAAMNALKILSQLSDSVEIDWELTEKLLTEVRLFKCYKTEAEYIEEVLNQVIMDKKALYIEPEVLNIPPYVLEPYCEHFINDREIIFFNQMYQHLISKCIYCCKEGYKNFVVDFKCKSDLINILYTDKRRMKEKIEYFFESIYEFINYNGFFNISIYPEKLIFNKYKVIVNFEVNLN